MTNRNVATLRVIDTHTGGEPTRVIVSGDPDPFAEILGPDRKPLPPSEVRERLRTHFDHFRTALINEPRGSDVMVGAILLPPTWHKLPACEPPESEHRLEAYATSPVAGVVFFNNVGYLGMCGHGTIGVAVALRHLNRVGLGRFLLETPVGTVEFELTDDNTVSFENVPSYRYRAGVTVSVPEVGFVTGDIAWSGNWFFLVHAPQFDLTTTPNLKVLTKTTERIRQALTANGITGENGGEIDHIEIFGPPRNADNHSRNFVLCPGGAYDRSPCGTGTSAKLACLYADGKLSPGQIWKQESIIGSLFEGSFRIHGDNVIPRITGTAYVNAETTILLDPRDPFRWSVNPATLSNDGRY